eukprot:Plantae.Rhodophyta-Hildenbrandia_rubra.ctg567.p1 GENE.Plantae.Rhodophyta-Hildenbrandia_rubra.ctg567~~Plantae.Rhodophyta-Hildenbrandia_rubra.ctg567.p1  ORF type:complete len:984 (+),score=111.50 Plantae.Rhodophyta-Hildenbrandia_rubra.ctg567:3118-6069(+)
MKWKQFNPLTTITSDNWAQVTPYAEVCLCKNGITLMDITSTPTLKLHPIKSFGAAVSRCTERLRNRKEKRVVFLSELIDAFHARCEERRSWLDFKAPGMKGKLGIRSSGRYESTEEKNLMDVWIFKWVLSGVAYGNIIPVHSSLLEDLRVKLVDNASVAFGESVPTVLGADISRPRGNGRDVTCSLCRRVSVLHAADAYTIKSAELLIDVLLPLPRSFLVQKGARELRHHVLAQHCEEYVTTFQMVSQGSASSERRLLLLPVGHARSEEVVCGGYSLRERSAGMDSFELRISEQIAMRAPSGWALYLQKLNKGEVFVTGNIPCVRKWLARLGVFLFSKEKVLAVAVNCSSESVVQNINMIAERMSTKLSALRGDTGTPGACNFFDSDWAQRQRQRQTLTQSVREILSVLLYTRQILIGNPNGKVTIREQKDTKEYDEQALRSVTYHSTLVAFWENFILETKMKTWLVMENDPAIEFSEFWEAWVEVYDAVFEKNLDWCIGKSNRHYHSVAKSRGRAGKEVSFRAVLFSVAIFGELLSISSGPNFCWLEALRPVMGVKEDQSQSFQIRGDGSLIVDFTRWDVTHLGKALGSDYVLLIADGVVAVGRLNQKGLHILTAENAGGWSVWAEEGNKLRLRSVRMGLTEITQPNMENDILGRVDNVEYEIRRDAFQRRPEQHIHQVDSPHVNKGKEDPGLTNICEWDPFGCQFRGPIDFDHKPLDVIPLFGYPRGEVLCLEWSIENDTSIVIVETRRSQETMPILDLGNIADQVAEKTKTQARTWEGSCGALCVKLPLSIANVIKRILGVRRRPKTDGFTSGVGRLIQTRDEAIVDITKFAQAGNEIPRCFQPGERLFIWAIRMQELGFLKVSGSCNGLFNTLYRDVETGKMFRFPPFDNVSGAFAGSVRACVALNAEIVLSKNFLRCMHSRGHGTVAGKSGDYFLTWHYLGSSGRVLMVKEKWPVDDKDWLPLADDAGIRLPARPYGM